MTQFNFQPDDPRLTAYALGELDPIERAQVEALLAESAEARTELEGIRETIALLSRELTFEPAFTLTASQRESVEQAASIDNGERLGVSPPCSAVVDTEGLRPAARLSKSRWGAIARTATTVTAVAAVAVAVPLVSRYWSDRSQNPSSNEELIVASNSAPGVAMARDETTPFASTDSSAVIRESQSTSSPSDSSEAISATSKRQDGEAVASRFAAAEVAGKPVSGESLAANFRMDESGLNGPVDSLSAGKEGKPAVVVAGQANAGGSAGESNDGRLMFGAGVGGNIASRPSGNNSGGVENEALLLASSDPEPESMSESIERRASELRGSTAAQWVDRAKKLAAEAKAAEDNVVRSLMVETTARAEADGYARGTESRGLGRLEERGRNEHPIVDGFNSHGRRLVDLTPSQQGIPSRATEVEDLEFERQSALDVARANEVYEPIVENAFLTPMEQPLSTFSIDVDSASYANMRRFIQQGQLPPANAVRIEELVNYFRYDYPEPADGSPFSVNIDVATCPWNPLNKLARVGLKAKTIAEDKRPATNLVFLIDVSGSMAAENKLPLVKQALSVLVSKMGENDQIAIVTYAGEAGLKLNSTSGSQQAVIQQAIDSLQSGGSTNGAAGINIAYDTAIQSFIKGGANRVILCTDGDFNVGVSDDNTLVEIIQEKAASGVFLSVFGFGMGNLKDAKLEKLADKGNGNYGYIDGLGEARKVFGEQLSGTLVTVAKDVKLQLEFNNSTVGAYRLIGYENRVLATKDFDDDTKDAGEIGAGHTVTALYEIVPKAAWMSQAGLDPEKFDIVEKPTANDDKKEAADGRLFTVKLRHKLPDAEISEKSQDSAAMNSDVQLSDSNVDFRFAAAVASFGMQIRDSKFRGNWTLQNVLSMADASLSTDRNGERTEFTDLVRGVMRIKGDTVTDPRLTMHETVAPATPPVELSANDARIKATVDGKYRRLLKKIEVRRDASTYGEFKDYGHWDGTSYSGHSDLPAGYWVWVYPNWYIWGDVVGTENFE
jgi:Ca-activated chloride channel family protein